MDFEKILAFLLILTIVSLSFYIYGQMNKKVGLPSIGSPIIPPGSTKNKICSEEKVSCDPNDPNACRNCADTEEMKCVNVSGENLCLPKEPDIKCNEANGGRYIWTGYGFTQSKDWQCLCSRPEIYNGPDCNTRNPSYCSNGVLAEDINTPLRNICKCNPGYELLFRDNNTPICVSNDPKMGGGDNGLYGNYSKSPDWKNVYFMGSNDKVTWANNIAKEFNYGNGVNVLNILNQENNKNKIKLDVDIFNSLIQTSNIFSTSLTPFDPNYRLVVPYRYFTQTYIP
jgi:hypothetical protein